MNNKTNTYDQIPSSITDHYTDDYDIFYIDSIIKKKLSFKYDEKKLRSKIYELESNLKSSEYSYNKKKCIINELNILRSELNNLESGEILNDYIERSKDLLKNYKTNKENRILKSFCEEKDHSIKIFKDKNTIERLIIIEKYLEIAKEYYDINIVNLPSDDGDFCNICFTRLNECILSDEGIKRCPVCFTDQKTISNIKSDQDYEKINENSQEESFENFMKILYEKQGLIPLDDIDDICKELDNHCRKTPGLDVSEIVKKRPLDHRGRREGTSHSMLRSMLSAIKRPKFFKKIDYIASVYWGWVLPNYSHLEDKIIRIYMETDRAYRKIPFEVKQRTSSIGRQFVLFKILQLCGCEVYIDEYKMAENEHSLENHYKLWEIMCDMANINNPDIYYIP